MLMTSAALRPALPLRTPGRRRSGPAPAPVPLPVPAPLPVPFSPGLSRPGSAMTLLAAGSRAAARLRGPKVSAPGSASPRLKGATPRGEGRAGGVRFLKGRRGGRCLKGAARWRRRRGGMGPE